MVCHRRRVLIGTPSSALRSEHLELEPGDLLRHRRESRAGPVVCLVLVVCAVRVSVGEVGDDREAPVAVAQSEVVSDHVAERAGTVRSAKGASRPVVAGQRVAGRVLPARGATAAWTCSWRPWAGPGPTTCWSSTTAGAPMRPASATWRCWRPGRPPWRAWWCGPAPRHPGTRRDRPAGLQLRQLPGRGRRGWTSGGRGRWPLPGSGRTWPAVGHLPAAPAPHRRSHRRIKAPTRRLAHYGRGRAASWRRTASADDRRGLPPGEHPPVGNPGAGGRAAVTRRAEDRVSGGGDCY